jgi:acyl transferase domain-containing protein
VAFAAAVQTLAAQGCTVGLELGPQPVLAGMASRYLGQEAGRLWLGSLRRGRSDWDQLLESLAALYVHGVAVDWSGFERDYPQRRKLALPTYPFQRQRYWVDLPRDRAAPAREGPATGSDAALAAGEAGLLVRLHQAPVGQRPQLLADFLQAVVADVLRLDPGQPLKRQAGFFDLGMDSLMAVELRLRLQAELGPDHPLPNTLTLDHPTIDGLTSFLAANVLSLSPVTNEDGVSKSGIKETDQALANIQQLPQEQLDALLEAELASLDALLERE